MHNTIEPALKSVFGFLPIFSGEPSAFGYLTAALILTIMITPIITSVTREVFETVPRRAQGGLLRARRDPLGDGPPGRASLLARRHRRRRSSSASGRAIGEAIAVAQVIGGATGINVSLFHTGGTLAAQIAAQFQGTAPGCKKHRLPTSA